MHEPKEPRTLKEAAKYKGYKVLQRFKDENLGTLREFKGEVVEVVDDLEDVPGIFYSIR